jgi:molybdenum cofactor cytidylyltransferase
MSGAAAIILAAGASRRLGRPKQTLELGGETLIVRAVRVAMDAGLSPVIVVVREIEHFVVELQQMGCLIVVNDKAEEGMASSIRGGVNAAKAINATGVVVMTCDQVALKAEHLQELTTKAERVTGSRYAGKVGIPAYFPSTCFAALMELKGDVGAREILRAAFAIENEELVLDIDTEDNFKAARERLKL